MRASDVWRCRQALSLFFGLMVAIFQSEASAGQRIERSIRAGERERQYIAHLPDSLSARPHWPVIIAFHPALGSAKGMEEYTRLHELEEAKAFVVVYPNGVGRTWNDGKCCGQAARQGIDDVGFVRLLLADLESIVPIEPKIYVTGWSNGARFVYRLMCDMSPLLAAAAPFAATLELEPSGCPAPSPVPLLHLHGEEDAQAPVTGGAPKGVYHWFASRVGNPPPPAKSVEFFAMRNGCTHTAGHRVYDAECKGFRQCNAGAEAMFCSIPRLGHVWPGATGAGSAVFGPERHDWPGSRVVMDFFLKHR